MSTLLTDFNKDVNQTRPIGDRLEASRLTEFETRYSEILFGNKAKFSFLYTMYHEYFSETCQELLQIKLENV